MGEIQKLVLTGVIVALVAGAVGYGIGKGDIRLPSRGTAGIAESASSGDGLDVSGVVLAGSSAIAVSDQAPGMQVRVELVTFAEDGWVVIHEDLDGQPGIILGAQRFNAGANQSGVVDLLRGTEEGRVYYAMLHRDDGDRQFDHRVDTPVADTQGNAILMRFIATTQPEEG